MNNCEKIMNIFFSLDKNEHFPLLVTLHLLFCKKCRSEVRLYTLAEKSLTAPLYVEVPVSNSILLSLREKINANESPAQTVSLLNWVIGGVAMILAMLTFIFWQKNMYFSPNIIITLFYTIFGCCVTAYCGLFVGSNMDFFIKKISMIRFIHHSC